MANLLLLFLLDAVLLPFVSLSGGPDRFPPLLQCEKDRDGGMGRARKLVPCRKSKKFIWCIKDNLLRQKTGDRLSKLARGRRALLRESNRGRPSKKKRVGGKEEEEGKCGPPQTPPLNAPSSPSHFSSSLSSPKKNWIKMWGEG